MHYSIYSLSWSIHFLFHPAVASVIPLQSTTFHTGDEGVKMSKPPHNQQKAKELTLRL